MCGVWEFRFAPSTDAFSALNQMEKRQLQFHSLSSEVWKAAGRSPEPHEPNAIITPQADRRGGHGRR